MPRPGGSNIEIAHHLTEHKESSQSAHYVILRSRRPWCLPWLPIATAWCGYQAALWICKRRRRMAKRQLVGARLATNAANQERLDNASTAVEWLNAQAQGNKKLATCLNAVSCPSFVRPLKHGRRRTDLSRRSSLTLYLMRDTVVLENGGRGES